MATTAWTDCKLTSLQLTNALLWRLTQTPQQTSPNELDILERNAASALSAVRFLRNMSSPVHRLPNEILAIIFRMVHEAEKPSCYLPRLPITRGTVKSITQVCRRWRETALRFPTLWTLIHRGQELNLVRSAGASLTVYIEGHPRWSPIDPAPIAADTTKFMEALVPHSGRIRELHLLAMWGEVTATDLLCSPAPQLESLTISLNPKYYQSLFTSGATLPTLFNGVIPKLRQLTLHLCPSWFGNNFKNLTHLTIRCQAVDASQFLPFLAASPHLEDLSLANVDTRFDGFTHAGVTLNHLRVLSISFMDLAQDVAQFISCLIIPQAINLYVWGTEFQPTDDIPVIFPLYRSQLGDIKQLRVTYCAFRHLGSPSAWGSERRYTVISTGSALQIDGKLEASQVLLSAPRVLGLGSVEELWLGTSFAVEPTEDEWRELFSSMPLLNVLVISRRPSQPIISALSLPIDALPRAPLLCPDLHTLHLYSDSSLSVFRLTIFAEERMKRERPLRSLKVTYTMPGPHPGGIYTPNPYAPHPGMPSEVPEPAGLREFRSDLMYLENYVQDVECVIVVDSNDWELLDVWPPPVYDWAPEGIYD